MFKFKMWLFALSSSSFKVLPVINIFVNIFVNIYDDDDYYYYYFFLLLLLTLAIITVYTVID